MKTLNRYIVFSILLLIVFSTLTNANSLKINTGSWQIVKQEKDTDTYISDKYSKTPLICEVYPEVKAKKDLPSRNIYTTKDKSEKKSLEQKTIKEKWANCYQVSTEKYVQIGDNSTILIYQNYSMVEYIDGDNNEITTNFLLKKFNGTDYKIESNDIWIKTEEECSNLGKEGLCFGATDNSMNETQLANYRYEINSTSQLSLIVREKDGYSYPVFTTSFNLAHWGEQTQEYKFDDICKNEYSNCDWDLVGNYAYINFVSNKYIDPTIFAGGNGSISNPYQINNCTQLQAINESLTSYYKIISNIDCSGVNFSPIRMTSIFAGELDGQGFNITNLKISKDGDNRVGLFSDLTGNISNVNIINAEVVANYDVGVLVGYARGGIITNCTIKDSRVNATSGTCNIGGMVGRNWAIIENSYVINSTIIGVSVSAASVGGFVGLATGGTINNSRVIDTLILAKGSGSSGIGGFVGRAEASFYKDYAMNINVTSGGGYVGGFVGNDATATAKINNSWVSGVVSGGGNYVGGFIGRNSATITNCYSIANVTNSADYVGGFIGYTATSSLINCYSAGLVTRTVAGSYVGGFAGRSSGGTITSCYYDNQTTNQTDTGKGTPLSTIKMKQQASFVNWDFATPIWYITENTTYPFLIYLGGDSLPPSIQVTFPLNNTYYKSNITSINYTITETNPSICWWFNGTTNSSLVTAGTNFTTNVLSNIGMNTWNVYCNDTSNNLGSSIVTFYVDSTNPNGNLINPTNNIYTNTNQNFTANATDNLGLKNATLNIYNSSNNLVNQTFITYIYGSIQSTFGVVVDLFDGVYTWFYQIFDLSGNSVVTENYTITIDKTAPEIFIITPNGATRNFNEYVSTGIRVNDSIGNVSYVTATIEKPDATIENLNLYLSPENVSIFPLYAYYSQFIILENDTVSSNQTCVGFVNTDGGYTSLSGNGEPRTNTFCSVISTLPFFQHFEATIYYNLTNLTSDSAINFQVSSGSPTSSSANEYAYIGRTNFAGEGNQYQVFGEDNVTSGFITKVDTTDTYGAMKIKRLNNNYSFYVLNNTDSSWINLGSQEFDFGYANYLLAESESISTEWGNASANWTNLTVIGLDTTIYKGVFGNTSQAGTYTITYFANDTLNNINNYTQASFKINETNQAPSTPFVLNPIINSLHNQLINILWSDITDLNNDTMVFNISLLNPDYTFNYTIIDDYGDLSSTNYIWNTTTVPDGIYSIRVQVIEILTTEGYSKSDTLSGTFRIDNTAPQYTIISPLNNTYTNLTNINFSINVTDMVNLSNGTLYIYNESSSLINETTIVLTGNYTIFSTNYTFLTDGVYNWFARIYDTAGNILETSLQTLSIDTIPPEMSYISPTLPNGTVITTNVIDVNINATDRSLSYIILTFYENGVLNITTNSTTSPFFYSFIELQNNSNYQFNATACDSFNQCTTLEMREIIINITSIPPIINDTITPNYTNLSPANSTYTNNTNINFSLNATDDTNLSNGTIYIYNSTGDLINTTTINLNDTSSIFSVVYNFVVDGVFHWFVRVYDTAGNFVETVLQKITIDTTSPDMAYTLPTLSNGSTTLDDFIEVNVTATDLNLSSINIYLYENYTLNQTINSLTSPFYHKFENLNNNTKYQFNASACDSLNYCTTLSTREITINSSISGTAELLVQISQYPYIDINQSTLFEGILTINGIPITDSNVNIFITNGTANWTYPMVYSSGTYKVNLQFTQEGDYIFIVNSEHDLYGNNSVTGIFYVRTPFYLTYEFITSSQNNTWYNFLIGNKYINEYAYVTAELLTNPRKYDPNIEPFFAQLPLTTRNQTPVWYGEYSNGIATIKLYETGNYAIRLIDGDITFTSDYSVPNITQSYGVNSYIGQTYLNDTTSKVELLTTKKLKPFTWLFNVILIILIIVSVIGSLFLFFVVPESPSIAISFGLIIPIVLIIVRILLWVWVA
jgi:hypothetical protein